MISQLEVDDKKIQSYKDESSTSDSQESSSDSEKVLAESNAKSEMKTKLKPLSILEWK